MEMSEERTAVPPMTVVATAGVLGLRKLKRRRMMSECMQICKNAVPMKSMGLIISGSFSVSL